MRNLIIIVFGSFLLVFTSCENLLIKELDLKETGYVKQLVIDGRIDGSSDSLSVLISQNIPITESLLEVIYLKDAKVSLNYNGSHFADLVQENEHEYHTMFQNGHPENGEYEIVVEHPEFETVRAITEIPPNVPVKSLRYIPNAGSEPFGMTEYAALEVVFDDPEGHNFYSFDVLTDLILRDTFIDGVPGDLDTIIEERPLYLYTEVEDPTSFFGNFSSPIYNDELFDGKEHLFFIRIYKYDPIVDFETLKNHLFLKWENLSEDFYNYETSLELYDRSSDFGLFSEPVTLYSNIENGLGIFAGVNRYFYRIE